MTVADWLELARKDIEAKNRPDLAPLLESLAQAMRVLRDADWNEDARDASSVLTERRGER
jgi:hypothetical protein